METLFACVLFVSLIILLVGFYQYVHTNCKVNFYLAILLSNIFLCFAEFGLVFIYCNRQENYGLNLILGILAVPLIFISGTKYKFLTNGHK